jgi:hypothetical protein
MLLSRCRICGAQKYAVDIPGLFACCLQAWGVLPKPAKCGIRSPGG